MHGEFRGVQDSNHVDVYDAEVWLDGVGVGVVELEDVVDARDAGVGDYDVHTLVGGVGDCGFEERNEGGPGCYVAFYELDFSSVEDGQYGVGRIATSSRNSRKGGRRRGGLGRVEYGANTMILLHSSRIGQQTKSWKWRA